MTCFDCQVTDGGGAGLYFTPDTLANTIRSQQRVVYSGNIDGECVLEFLLCISALLTSSRDVSGGDAYGLDMASSALELRIEPPYPVRASLSQQH